MLAFLPTAAPGLARELGVAPGMTRAACSGPLLTGSFGTGPQVVDIDAGSAADLDGVARLLPAGADVLRLTELAAESPEPALRHGVKRVLVLRVHDGAPAPLVAHFERDLARMPRYIPAIRNWALSRVEPGSRWTHAWEQEYRDRESFAQYMDSPYHWGVIEPWFDPEFPECIVDPAVAQVFYAVDDSLLARPS